jgi:hypothetical protein
LFVGANAEAGLLVPEGLEPGEKYHLVFNSSVRTSATSSDIETYNAFVQRAADRAGIGSSEDTTWFAIASTETIDARDNAVVGAETPVYNMRLDLVATGFEDMWDGSLNRSLSWDERGRRNGTDAWSGSRTDGTAARGLTLGNSSGRAWCGNPSARGARWLNNQTPPTSIGLSLYGLSMELTVPFALGDFDEDGMLTAMDIDALSMAVGEQSNDMDFDLNEDGMVDLADREVWVHELKSTWYGDANLDGTFDSADIIGVFQAGMYELATEAGWSEGDWTGDGRFDSSDVIAAFQDGGYEVGARAAVSAVPEPSSAILVVFGIAGLCFSLRK